jgi:hypothetical protein
MSVHPGLRSSRSALLCQEVFLGVRCVRGCTSLAFSPGLCRPVFAPVDKGFCRAQHASHTMRMNSLYNPLHGGNDPLPAKFPRKSPLACHGAKNGIPARGVISSLHLFPSWRSNASATISRMDDTYACPLVFPGGGIVDNRRIG